MKNQDDTNTQDSQRFSFNNQDTATPSGFSKCQR